MDIKTIEELARVMRENELSSLEVKEGDSAVKLERQSVSNAGPVSVMPVPAADPVSVPAPEAAQKQSVSQKGSLVLSPTVGVFYTAASPDAKPFVEVGDHVKKGDVLCIIEAMKLMNEITSETDGVVTEICVNNGQVVEYNQPLFRII